MDRDKISVGRRSFIKKAGLIVSAGEKFLITLKANCFQQKIQIKLKHLNQHLNQHYLIHLNQEKNKLRSKLYELS